MGFSVPGWGFWRVCWRRWLGRVGVFRPARLGLPHLPTPSVSSSTRTPGGQGEQRSPSELCKSAEEGWKLAAAGAGLAILCRGQTQPTFKPARCAHDGSWNGAVADKSPGCGPLSRCGTQRFFVCFGVCVFESRTCRFKRSTRQLTASGDQGRRARSARASGGGRRSPRTRKRATGHRLQTSGTTLHSAAPLPPSPLGMGGWGGGAKRARQARKPQLTQTKATTGTAKNPHLAPTRPTSAPSRNPSRNPSRKLPRNPLQRAPGSRLRHFLEGPPAPPLARGKVQVGAELEVVAQ